MKPSRSERRRALREAAKAGRLLRHVNPKLAAQNEQAFVRATQLALDHAAHGRTVQIDWNPLTRESGLAAVLDLENGDPSVWDHFVLPATAALPTPEKMIRTGLDIGDLAPRIADQMILAGLWERAETIARDPTIAARFAAALAELPEELSRAVRLSQEGMDERQIASSLFCTADEASKLLADARAQLHLALRDPLPN